MTDVDLDLPAIQGIVLRGYRMPLGSYLLLTFGDPGPGRAWIRAVAPEVTTAAPWDAKPDAVITVGLSAHGLRALEVPDEVLASFPESFLAGMAARADALGDTALSAPEHWQGGFGTEAIHAAVLISATTPEALQERITWLAGSLPDGVTQVFRQDVARLENGSEHFGYTDGFSQPDIEGLELSSRHGQGVYEGEGRWRPIRPGEFVIGYPDEDGVLSAGPQPEDLGRNGSYLALRKLRQDVIGFREQLAQHAVLTGLAEEVIAAKMVGRWKDGTPLVLSPDHPDPEIVADPDRVNVFDFADDPHGYKCPVGAHIRRMNPRLSMPFDGKLVNRHRLVRRGLPYGPELPPEAPDDGVERGIMFACFQADLERQFEFIQSQWIDDGNAFGLGTDEDPLIGSHEPGDKFTINGAPPVFLGPMRQLVITQGGEYFFVPGINGLEYLGGLGS
jgi:Dyp-type peroxidase family